MTSIQVFISAFWEDCGNDIAMACMCWLALGVLPTTLNETNIALIPKKDDPDSMVDWRPISLCNVLCKLISKVFANRLKVILHKCISIE